MDSWRCSGVCFWQYSSRRGMHLISWWWNSGVRGWGICRNLSRELWSFHSETLYFLYFFCLFWMLSSLFRGSRAGTKLLYHIRISLSSHAFHWRYRNVQNSTIHCLQKVTDICCQISWINKNSKKLFDYVMKVVHLMMLKFFIMILFFQKLTTLETAPKTKKF